jgi:hypothetical protein
MSSHADTLRRRISIAIGPSFPSEREALAALDALLAAIQQLRASNEALKAHRATIQGVVGRAEEAEAENQQLRDALHDIGQSVNAAEKETHDPRMLLSFAAIKACIAVVEE